MNQEIELQSLLDSLRAAKDDASKEKWNLEFKTQLQRSLNEPTAFTYPFSKLRTVGKVDSPDKQIRIISWNVEQDDESQKYYAFVLKADEKKGTFKVIELVDNSMMLPSRTDEVLDPDNWYGALYYQIIPVEKNNKTYYTLLGWDGNSNISNIKLIDVLYFTGNSLKLGAPIFKSGDKTEHRVYMEHSEKTVMSLRWEEEYQRIIFDHLSPETASMEGFYEFYVPDMSYDALVFKGNKWTLVEDVIGINHDDETVKLQTMNAKTGEVEETDMPNKWIDPTTSGAPGGKEVHLAMTPELAEGTDATDKPTKTVKKDPKNAMETYDAKKHHKEKDPSTTFVNGKGKKKKKRS